MRSNSQKPMQQASRTTAKSAPVQAKTRESGLPELVLQMQRTVGNRAVTQMLTTMGTSSSKPIQRKPDQFKNVVSNKLVPKGPKNSWSEFYENLQAYANVEENSPKRIELFHRLIKSRIQAKADLYGQEPPENQEEQNHHHMKLDFLNNITDHLQNESLEMSGTLQVDSSAIAESAEPELLEHQDDSEVKVQGAASYKIHGGVFKQEVDLVDATGKVIRKIPAGKVCEIHADNTAPAGQQPDDVWKVKPNKMIGNSDNYEDFVEGYVKRAEVTITGRLKQNPKLEHRAETRPLFPHPPKLEDVVQGGIGDCYLLAAVQSILHTNPGHFPSHMSDNGDSVTVRLYDVVDNGGNKTFTPKDIKVKKTSVYKRGLLKDSEAFASGPIWVHMLEKAYAAVKFNGSNTEEVPLQKAAYGTIASGRGDVAVEHLLGRQTERTPIQPLSDDTDNLPYYMMASIKDAALKMEYMGFVAALKTKFDTFKSKEEATRQGDFMKILSEFNTGPNSEAIKQAVEQYWTTGKSKSNVTLPDKRGTGSYTEEQLALSEKITQKIDENKPITIGSKEKVFTPPPPSIFNKVGIGRNSESMGKGLVATHAYSILDYRSKKTDKGRVIEFKIRNPWGEYGRKYDKGHAKEDKAAGEFWIDLSDLTKRFHTVYSEV